MRQEDTNDKKEDIYGEAFSPNNIMLLYNLSRNDTICIVFSII